MVKPVEKQSRATSEPLLNPHNPRQAAAVRLAMPPAAQAAPQASGAKDTVESAAASSAAAAPAAGTALAMREPRRKTTKSIAVAKRPPARANLFKSAAYLNMWKALAKNDSALLATSLNSFAGADDLIHVLKNELSETLAKAAFPAEGAPADAVLRQEDAHVAARLYDAYSLISKRAECGRDILGPERPASIAAALGHVELLQVLSAKSMGVLTREDTCTTPAGMPQVKCQPSFWAAWFGQVECLEFLADMGVPMQPVHQAISYTAHPKTVAWLVKRSQNTLIDSVVQRARGTDVADEAAVIKLALSTALGRLILASKDVQLTRQALAGMETLVNVGRIDLAKLFVGPYGPTSEISAERGWLRYAMDAQAWQAAEHLVTLGAPSSVLIEKPEPVQSEGGLTAKLNILRKNKRDSVLWREYASRDTQLLQIAVENAQPSLVKALVSTGGASVTPKHRVAAIECPRTFATLSLLGHGAQNLAEATDLHKKARLQAENNGCEGEDIDDNLLVSLTQARVDYLHAQRKRAKAAVLAQWATTCKIAAEQCLREDAPTDEGVAQSVASDDEMFSEVEEAGDTDGDHVA